MTSAPRLKAQEMALKEEIHMKLNLQAANMARALAGDGTGWKGEGSGRIGVRDPPPDHVPQLQLLLLVLTHTTSDSREQDDGCGVDPATEHGWEDCVDGGGGSGGGEARRRARPPPPSQVEQRC